MKLPTQLHAFGRRTDNPLLRTTVEDWKEGAIPGLPFERLQKPEEGLWTSTWLGDGSPWTRWCESEDFDVPWEGLWEGVLLEPEDCRVLTIDDWDDFTFFVREYRHGYANAGLLTYDWKRIAEDWDAVHLSEEGNAVAHFPLDLIDGEHADLNSWDCESTVWLRWKFQSWRPVGFVPVRRDPPEPLKLFEDVDFGPIPEGTKRFFEGVQQGLEEESPWPFTIDRDGKLRGKMPRPQWRSDA